MKYCLMPTVGGVGGGKGGGGISIDILSGVKLLRAPESWRDDCANSVLRATVFTLRRGLRRKNDRCLVGVGGGLSVLSSCC